MNSNKKLQLIEGEFSFNEAKEILTSMFNSKINFHNIQNWSSQERYGKDDETAQKKIPLLKNEIEKLEEIILEAKANNKKLVINSEIIISLKDN
jgi:hemerythrin superfamily protein